MKRCMLYMMALLCSVATLTACSSAENELTDMQDDMVTHVKDNVVQVREKTLDYQDRMVDKSDMDEEEFAAYKEEFVTYLHGEATEKLAASQDYLQQYETPKTDEGKAYFKAYKSTLEAYFLLLEQNSQFIVDLMEDNLTEEDFDTHDQEMAQIDKKIDQQLAALEKLTDKYSDQYDIHFVDPLY